MTNAERVKRCRERRKAERERAMPVLGTGTTLAVRTDDCRRHLQKSLSEPVTNVTIWGEGVAAFEIHTDLDWAARPDLSTEISKLFPSGILTSGILNSSWGPLQFWQPS